ncbi:MAG: MEDS domain-containing protein [Tepidanaerobacteraceae bacterium]|jgi:PAS domain S-box-containing protein
MSYRKTGIDILGDVTLGTHICQFYSLKSDLLILALFMKEGLQNNELCVWIYSQNTTFQQVKEIISTQVNDIDDYINSGQLKIIPYTSWYVINESFDENRVNGLWIKLAKYADENRFNGIRAIGDTGWLKKSDFETFSCYEHNITGLISELPIIVICLYNLSKLDLFEFAQVVKNHEFTIIKHNNELRLIKNQRLLINNKLLEQSKEDYQKLLQLLPITVLIHDKQKIFYCNDAAIRLFGVDSKQKLIGKTMIEFIVADKKNEYEAYIDQVLVDKTQICFSHKSSLLDKSGQQKDIEVVARNCIYNDFPAVLSVIRDVSHLNKMIKLERVIERKDELLNEAIEKEKIKTLFLSRISHELRTPINMILSALQLIELRPNNLSQDYDKIKYFRVMRQNCYRLLRLVNNLIDLTKIDSDFFELNLTNCNIVEFVEDITLSVTEYLENKGLKLQFDTNVEEKIITCDPDQIERIILNLISNAIKFTPPGGNVWVTFEDLNNKVKIIVRDNGVGIPENKQKTIFYRFEQVEKLFTRKHEGSGLGLPLVKSLVEKHGGKIEVKSRVGKGSEFTVILPCKKLIRSECLSKLNNPNGHNFVERASIELSDISV